MQFSAGALAVIASGRGVEHDGRHLTTQQQKASASNVLKNRENQDSVTTNILRKLKDLQEVVECDPQVEIEETRRLRNHHHHDTGSIDSDQEFGILSPVCGVGRQCREGLCVDVEGRNRQRGLQTDIVNSGPAVVTDADEIEMMDDLAVTYYTDSNTTAEEIPPETIEKTALETMQYACAYGALVGYDCDCNFDTVSYTGSGTCTTPRKCATKTSVCNREVTNCYQTAYTLSLLGEPNALGAQLCLEFLEPYQQTACYDTQTLDNGASLLPSCNMTLDGELCNSCSVEKFGDNNCYTFDCGNTALAGNGRGSLRGNTCDLPAHSVGLFLDTYGCPPCELCGGGDMVMTSPASLMNLFNTSYECAYVQDVALQGFFTEDSCRYFVGKAQEPCGCGIPGTMDEDTTPVDIEVVMETESPTVSPTPVVIEDGGDSVSTPAPTEDFCRLCGPGKVHDDDDTMVSVPTQGFFTCGELAELGKNGTLDENGICLLVQLSAKSPCNCAPEFPTMAPSTPAVEGGQDSVFPADLDSAASRTSLAAGFVTAAAAVMSVSLSW